GPHQEANISHCDILSVLCFDCFSSLLEQRTIPAAEGGGGGWLRGKGSAATWRWWPPEDRRLRAPPLRFQAPIPPPLVRDLFRPGRCPLAARFRFRRDRGSCRAPARIHLRCSPHRP